MPHSIVHISLVFAQKRSLTFSDDIQNIGATVHHGSIYSLRLLPNKPSKVIAKLEDSSTFWPWSIIFGRSKHQSMSFIYFVNVYWFSTPISKCNVKIEWNQFIGTIYEMIFFRAINSFLGNIFRKVQPPCARVSVLLTSAYEKGSKAICHSRFRKIDRFSKIIYEVLKCFGPSSACWLKYTHQFFFSSLYSTSS